MPPALQTSEGQLAGQPQYIENKGFIRAAAIGACGLVDTLCRDGGKGSRTPFCRYRNSR